MIVVENSTEEFVNAVRAYAFEKLDLAAMKKELTEQFGREVLCHKTKNCGVQVYTVIDDEIVRVTLSACED